MAISVTCEKCGATYEVPEDRAGQVGKCRCGSRLQVPGTPPVARPAGPSPPAVAPSSEPVPERTAECRQCGMLTVPGDECEWCHALLAVPQRPLVSAEAEGVPKPTGTTLNSVLAVLVLLVGTMLVGVAGYTLLFEGTPLTSPDGAWKVIFFGVGVLLMVSAVGLFRLHMAAWWTLVAVLTVSVLSHVSGLLGGPAPFVILILHPIGGLALQVVLLLYYLWARESFVQAGVGGVKLVPTLLVCLPLLFGVVLLILAGREQRAHYSDMLVSAVNMGDLRAVQTYLGGGADPNERDDQLGWTALMWAANAGRADIAAALLKAGADPNAKGSKDGSTALGCAYSHPDLIQMLKEAGAK